MHALKLFCDERRKMINRQLISQTLQSHFLHGNAPVVSASKIISLFFLFFAGASKCHSRDAQSDAAETDPFSNRKQRHLLAAPAKHVKNRNELKF